MVSYTKLRSGEWGVRSTEKIAPGDKVQVMKKSGELKGETVSQIVWTGEGVWLAAIGSGDKPKQSRHGGRSRAPRGMVECDECGDYVRPGTTCWETGMRH